MTPHKTTRRNLPAALQNFDELPDSAHVRVGVVAALFACSIPTIWRRVRDGAIPAPVKLGPRVTAWNVGALRAASVQALNALL